MTRAAVANTSTHIQGSVDYSVSTSSSGITVSVTFQMRRTNAYSNPTYSSSAVPSICISSSSSSFNYSGGAGITIAGGRQNVWQTVYSASRTFDPSRGGGNIYVGWKVSNDNSGGFLGGSAVESITLPTVYTAPNTPTLSASPAASSPTDSIEITWGTSSFGTPSSGTVYLYGGTSASPTSQLLTKTTTGNSTFVHNEPLIPNTRYYYRSRACNSQLCSSYSSDVSAITNPIPPILTINSITHDTATFTISAPSQGSARTLKALYKIDNDPTTETMVTPPATVSQSFLPGSTHTISAYFSASPTVSSTTVSETFTMKVPFYGSVNGVSKGIQKLYGSVNGETKLVEHLYGAVYQRSLTEINGEIDPDGPGNVTSFNGETLFNTISQDPVLAEAIIDSDKDISAMTYQIADNNNFWQANLVFSDSSYIVLGGLTFSINDPADLGITVSYTADGTDTIDLTGTYSTGYFTKLIY